MSIPGQKHDGTACKTCNGLLQKIWSGKTDRGRGESMLSLYLVTENSYHPFLLIEEEEYPSFPPKSKLPSSREIHSISSARSFLYLSLSLSTTTFPPAFKTCLTILKTKIPLTSYLLPFKLLQIVCFPFLIFHSWYLLPFLLLWNDWPRSPMAYMTLIPVDMSLSLCW